MDEWNVSMRCLIRKEKLAFCIYEKIKTITIWCLFLFFCILQLYCFRRALNVSDKSFKVTSTMWPSIMKNMKVWTLDVQVQKSLFKQKENQTGGHPHKKSESIAVCPPSLFIINPSLHLSIGSHAVRLYWGGAECVYKVTTRANSWPLGCPRSQQTINPANVNWDNQRKRLHLWFAACKHFNRLRCWSRCRQGPRPWPSSRLRDSLVFVTWTKQRRGNLGNLGNMFYSPSALHLSSLLSVAGFVICINGPSEDEDQVDIFDSQGQEGISEDFTQPKSDSHQGLSRWGKQRDQAKLAW